MVAFHTIVKMNGSKKKTSTQDNRDKNKTTQHFNFLRENPKLTGKLEKCGQHFLSRASINKECKKNKTDQQRIPTISIHRRLHDASLLPRAEVSEAGFAFGPLGSWSSCSTAGRRAVVSVISCSSSSSSRSFPGRQKEERDIIRGSSYEGVTDLHPPRYVSCWASSSPTGGQTTVRWGECWMLTSLLSNSDKDPMRPGGEVQICLLLCLCLKKTLKKIKGLWVRDRRKVCVAPVEERWSCKRLDPDKC